MAGMYKYNPGELRCGMKYLRLRSRPDPARAPALFELLADSPHATETRLIDWNLGPTETATLLYEVDGDAEGFRAAATETPGIESVAVTTVGTGRFYALVEARPRAVPLLRQMLSALIRAGLVVLTPVHYRDGTVDANIVGDPAALQAALDAAPDAIDVSIEEIGQFRGPPSSLGTTLSERQREAAEAALELGYYEQPSRATHEDIADALDCAPSTASEHLKRAEAKLVSAGVDVDRHAE